jgi:hypothetical protein
MKNAINSLLEEITARKMILRVPHNSGITTTFDNSIITNVVDTVELNVEASMIYNFIVFSSIVRNYRALQHCKAIFKEKYLAEYIKLRGGII